nr:PREDICTED: tumor suppressor candidate 3-like [Bemisia tabaci]
MRPTISFFCLVSCVFIFSNCNGQVKTKSISLSERVEQLSQMSFKRSVIKFNPQKFKDFVKATPRNYSVVIMFTAIAPARQCSICRQASEEFNIVANSHRYSATFNNDLFFVVLDFDGSADVFQWMKINTAPMFIHFPPKGKPKQKDTLDVQRVGFAAEAIAKWIHEQTDIQIRVFRPPNYSNSVAFLLVLCLLGGFLYLRRNNLDILYNKTLWGVAAVFFCFSMVSGQMWNHIRSPPFVHKSHNGGIMYIHGSSQGQFVLETYIVIVLNAAIVIGMIMMIDAASKKGGVRVRRIMAILGLVFVAIDFSVILSIFRSKAHGYPYSFLI